ncbi:tuberin-like isoform X2 [Ornithodoros turicata]|uniref:tuberin-like isoform X2 n=1 Tax=Ornithodoros turicata TaxID=34597 RepID=UPI00313899C4
MSKNSKEKEKPLERIKSLFGLGKGGSSSSSTSFAIPKIEELPITAEILKDIGKESSTQHRMKAIKDLIDVVRTKRLEKNAPKTLYVNTCDLLNPRAGTEVRHLVLGFYCHLIQGQYDRLDVSRAHFFDLIVGLQSPEDLQKRLDLFKALTDNGKNVSNFEVSAALFLLKWMPDVLNAGKATEFFSLLVNVIKFNSAFLDKDVVTGIVHYTCILCCRTNSENSVKLGLDVLDSIVGYSTISSDILPHLVPTVCRTVVVANLSEPSYRLMHNLQGTHLGHSVVEFLCRILEDRINYRDHTLLKGAMFFLGAGLWGSKAVATLKHTPAHVLPSIEKALDSKHAAVAYEAAVALHWLMYNRQALLTAHVCKFLLDVLAKLVCLPEVQHATNSTQQLRDLVLDLVAQAEAMHDNGSFQGPADKLFDIVEKCVQFAPESSVQRLIQYQAHRVQLPAHNWVSNLSQLVERYFQAETCGLIREKTLDVLSFVLSTNRHFYEEELLENVILPHFGSLDSISNPVIVTKAVQLLTDFLQDSASARNEEVLEIVGKVLNHPSWSTKPGSAEEVRVIETTAQGLIDVFKKKMRVGPESAILAYKLLTDHLLQQYGQPEPVDDLAPVRLVILNFLLCIRLDEACQLGISDDDGVHFSPHLLPSTRESLSDKASQVASSPSAGSPVVEPAQLNVAYMNLEDAFKAVVACVKLEREWTVLSSVLQHLPGLMKDRGLVLCGQCSIKKLCLALCSLVADKGKKAFEQLRRVPPGVVSSDLIVLVFPVLGVLTIYRGELDSYVVRMFISSLEVGLVSKSACTCIRALMLATLEMPDAMYKLFPDVLQKLAQISATVAVAVPLLEYLSNVIRIPQLYVSFVEEEYRKIFAIALPYTNPVKFNHFTVALALHVIAMWFLKCRITFRKDFVSYIIKNLRSNLDLHPEDSSLDELAQRKRSSSLNDPSSSSGQPRRIDPRHSVASVNYSPGASSSSDTALLQEELLEMFVDLMSQYSFGMCSSNPKRTPASEHMVKNGRSMTWLVGRKLVTVTTSGCGNRAFRVGMCERCYRTCRDSAEDDDDGEQLEKAQLRQHEYLNDKQGRRRHQSDFQGRSVGRAVPGRTKDDLSLREVTTEQQNSTANTEPVLPPAGEPGKVLTHVCSCWCIGWAEIFVRSATGNVSWMIRLQNNMFSKTCNPDFPLPDLTSIFQHLQLEGDEPERPPVSRSTSLDCGLSVQEESRRDSTTSHSSDGLDGEQSINYSSAENLCVTKRSASPLRRTNSSPEVPGHSASSPTTPVAAATSPRSSHVSIATMLPTSSVTSRPLSPSGHPEDEQTRLSALRKSPRKEDRYESIPEESHSTARLRPLSKAHLKLDFSHTKFSSAAGPATAEVVLRPRQALSPPAPRMRSSNLRSDGASTKLSRASSFRDRGHTVSGMSPVAQQVALPNVSYIDMYRCGMNPNFVFLHLYNNAWFSKHASERPILLPESFVERSLTVFDYLPTYETHKIGVLYVGPGQAKDSTAILSNHCGSQRYTKFILGLGRTIRLRETDPKMTYVGGLDFQESDGNYAISWQDDIMQVIYHVATLMPNREKDKLRSNKKRHIGNDLVIIVYNESGQEYSLNTMGEFANACVIIEPRGFAVNIVSLKGKPEVMELLKHSDAQIVPDNSLSLYVRQLALHANIAATIVHKANSKHVYVNNWHERLRHIKRIHERLTAGKGDGDRSSEMNMAEDFMAYM